MGGVSRYPSVGNVIPARQAKLLRGRVTLVARRPNSVRCTHRPRLQIAGSTSTRAARSTVLRSNRRTTRVHLPTGASFVSVMFFPSLSTSPVTWIFAPAFAASVLKFWFWMA